MPYDPIEQEIVNALTRFHPIALVNGIPVSYTHLDVYKRQTLRRCNKPTT